MRRCHDNQDASLKAQNHAAELKLRAERRLGELLSDMDMNKGTQGQFAGRDTSGNSIMEAPEVQPPTLKELGIEPKESMRWQLEATVPEERFEEYITEGVEPEQAVADAVEKYGPSVAGP